MLSDCLNRFDDLIAIKKRLPKLSLKVGNHRNIGCAMNEIKHLPHEVDEHMAIKYLYAALINSSNTLQPKFAIDLRPELCFPVLDLIVRK